MAKPDNEASNASPADTRLQRAEQALMWALKDLSDISSSDSGVSDACADIYPELNVLKLIDKGYPQNWPESYSEY